MRFTEDAITTTGLIISIIKTIATIVDAWPQFIKVARVSEALAAMRAIREMPITWASITTSDLAQTIEAALGTQGVDAQPYGDGKAAAAIAGILTRSDACAEPA